MLVILLQGLQVVGTGVTKDFGFTTKRLHQSAYVVWANHNVQMLSEEGSKVLAALLVWFAWK